MRTIEQRTPTALVNDRLHQALADTPPAMVVDEPLTAGGRERFACLTGRARSLP
jgi:hypothetical protein